MRADPKSTATKPSARSRSASRVRRALAAIGATLVLAIAVGAASYYSPWMALSRLRAAALAGDKEALAAGVDWAGARDKMVVRMSTAALRASGMSPSDERVGPTVLAIQGAVDAVATPENAIKVAQQTRASGAEVVVRGDYLDVGVFVFAVENKTSKTALTLRMRRLGPFSWRVDDAIVLDPRLLGGR